MGGKMGSEMLLAICLSISWAADVGKQTTYHVVNTFSFFLSMNPLFLSEKPIYNVTNRISYSFKKEKKYQGLFSLAILATTEQLFYPTKYIEFCAAKRGWISQLNSDECIFHTLINPDIVCCLFVFKPWIVKRKDCKFAISHVPQAGVLDWPKNASEARLVLKSISSSLYAHPLMASWKPTDNIGQRMYGSKMPLKV